MAKEANKVITIIGIDSSTSCTGISVIEKIGKKEKLLYHGKTIPSKDLCYEEKILLICSDILKVYEQFEDRDPIVAIELLNSIRGVNVARILAGLWASIKVTIFNYKKKRVLSLNTKNIKKIVTGDGNCDKYKMVKYMNTYFKLKLKFHKTNKTITDDDIADSMAVAIAVSRILDKGEDLNDYL